LVQFTLVHPTSTPPRVFMARRLVKHRTRLHSMALSKAQGLYLYLSLFYEGKTASSHYVSLNVRPLTTSEQTEGFSWNFKWRSCY